MISSLRVGSLLLPGTNLGCRSNSTLASRMKLAAATTDSYESEEDHQHRLKEQVDEYGEQFRELFINPKRKLMAQLQLERLTGRTEREKFSRPDIHDRLAVRRPRAEEMPVDQDWPSVWPVAATYKSSVVPLPIRMGTRKEPEKRAPFKRIGNLELLKIPNFLHLTPDHIKRHCEAIKKFTTPFPSELIQNPSLIESEFPVTVKYSDYLHQGTSLRDPRARVNTIEVKLDAFPCFDEHAKDKFCHLVKNRFNEKTNTLTIVTDRCYTRKQNREYADFLLTALYYEALKVEPWEQMKERADNLKVQFGGSKVEKRIAELLKKEDNVISSLAVKEFAEMWYEYRNQPETSELTRSYEDKVRKLLGISRLVETETSKSAAISK